MFDRDLVEYAKGAAIEIDDCAVDVFGIDPGELAPHWVEIEVDDPENIGSVTWIDTDAFTRSDSTFNSATGALRIRSDHDVGNPMTSREEIDVEKNEWIKAYRETAKEHPGIEWE